MFILVIVVILADLVRFRLFNIKEETRLQLFDEIFGFILFCTLNISFDITRKYLMCFYIFLKDFLGKFKLEGNYVLNLENFVNVFTFLTIFGFSILGINIIVFKK